MPADPKRNWFQFSLRLLILVVVAVNMYWWEYRHVQSLREEIAASRAETKLWMKRAHASVEMTPVQIIVDNGENTLWSRSMITLNRWAYDDTYGPSDSKRSLGQWLEAVTEHSTFDGWNKELMKQAEEIAALKARLIACGCAGK